MGMVNIRINVATKNIGIAEHFKTGLVVGRLIKGGG